MTTIAKPITNTEYNKQLLSNRWLFAIKLTKLTTKRGK